MSLHANAEMRDPVMILLTLDMLVRSSSGISIGLDWIGLDWGPLMMDTIADLRCVGSQCNSPKGRINHCALLLLVLAGDLLSIYM